MCGLDLPQDKGVPQNESESLEIIGPKLKDVLTFMLSYNHATLFKTFRDPEESDNFVKMRSNIR